MHRTRLLGAALCVLAMSACSVDVQGKAEPAESSAPPAAAAPGGQRAADAAQVDAACPLLDGEKVGATLGGTPARAVEQPVEEEADGTRTMHCIYQVSARAAVALLQFTVLPGGKTPSEIIARVSAAAGEGNGEPIEGLGEAAVLTSDGQIVELSSAFIAGGTPVLTSLTASKAATKDMIQPLLAEVIDKF